MHETSAIKTLLFTDIERSVRLWEQEPERMRPALARHDAIAKAAVKVHRGRIVKMTGDGVHAAFDDPLDAIGAVLELQQTLADVEATGGIALSVRCGLHAGVDERRDNDFFGGTVNRAARIAGAAHGGQVLVSEAVAVLVRDRLPEDVSLRDLGLVRLRDLERPVRVLQLMHPRLRKDFPALRSLEATPNNLPQQITSFVGRDRDLAEIKLILGRTRLLTVLGAGGIGKTRLSLHLAADLIDDHPDGVWFVDLAPLADPRLVPQAVAGVLGIKEEVGRPVVEALEKHFNDARVLLILDNCEHLVLACAELVKRLLHSGPNSKIVVTSRERLNVTGESTYSVPPLAVPDMGTELVHAAVMQCAAARLFVDRAVAAQPAFQVSDRNATAVADICCRLDGMPLAIELAAARVRTLEVSEIAARLSDRFRLLSGGDRTALPRQQTLRALIDWSYDLLTERERILLRRLAVFAGGWTLDAAEAIAAGGELEQAEVFDILGHLVEKSLVVVEHEGRRYRLLEIVRQYAQERLDGSGEGGEVRTGHLAYFLAFVERAALRGPEAGAWLARLDLEAENVLAAHAWCDHAVNGGDMGLRLVHSLKIYLMHRGLVALGLGAMVEALARAGAQERNATRSRALVDAGQLACLMSNYSEARGYLEESLAIAREIGDKARVAAVLQPLGLACLGEGHIAAARRHLEETLTLAEELGNKREVATALNALAQLSRVEGDLDSAEPRYQQVLALARELGDREIIAISLLNLAMVCIGRSAGDHARSMLLEALGIALQSGAKPAGQSVLEVCAGLAAMRGETELAARFYGMAEAQTERTGIHRDPADDAFLAPRMVTAREMLGESLFAVAKEGGRVLSYEQAIAEARAWLERRV